MAVLSEEQTLLKDMAASWVQDRAPVTAFRAAAKASNGLRHDPALYNEMAEMGWTGILVPEAHGGVDFGHFSLGLILEELGRTLVASPLLGSALVGAAALRLGATAEKQARWLPAIASGEAIVALAVDESGRHDPGRIACVAKADGNGWVLDGVKTPVLDGAAANLFIVAARTSDSAITLFLVEADSEGLARTPLNRIDGRDAATLTFSNVRVDGDSVLGQVDAGGALLERVLDRGRAGLAAEMLGSATQAFETTLDYLKTRVQFGQLIGSFQALQHRAVKMLGEIELTRSAVEAALAAIDEDQEDVPALVSLAKALAGDTLRLVAGEMVQMHGGIGMTEEHDAGLYLKRAAAADATWGNSAFHRERYGRLVGY
jgi:alkylation response protein AidB-like acyl-CoA dehydrogenase